jgi:FMN-dependent NADH-azoreductase
MITLLHVDASARAIKNKDSNHGSLSKKLASDFVKTWQENRTTDEHFYRDVGINPPDFISEDWINAAFTPKANRTVSQNQTLALSDALIGEVSAADIIVISSPMYNYGMPAQLKAWFDQIVRINETFDFDLQRGDFPLRPTLSGKTLIVITSSGEFGFREGGIRQSMNHLTPHLRTLSQYLGVETIHEIACEYQEFGDARHRQSLENATIQAKSLAQTLSRRIQS